jgi:hypothetical protein
MILSFLTQTNRLSNTVSGCGMNIADFMTKNDIPQIEDSPLPAAGNPSSSIHFTLLYAARPKRLPVNLPEVKGGRLKAGHLLLAYSLF